MDGDGLYYYNVASLSKDSGTGYSLVAVDNNGVSSITNAVNAWPLVLITAPVDKSIGGAVNPYAYTVPAASTNFVRALVFDAGAISQVRFRIDSGTNWVLMSPVAAGSHVWQGSWNASALSAGSHTIEVQAAGTTTVSDSITVEVTSAGNRAPVAVNDTYSVDAGATLIVSARGVLGNDSDPDGDVITAQEFSAPGHGTLIPNADGSFRYTPSAEHSGTDSFTYRAKDASLLSNVATVTITVNAAPAADTVTIVTATWTRRTKTLLVEATSSAQPNASLTVVGFGGMTYNTKTKRYRYTKVVDNPPASVTVESNLHGTATKAVTQK
jgi:hypothetical protein